jgi:glycosyltransferase involved in cell wall biosynthesis
VIGSRVGGIQYTVQHGRTGFLVEPKEPADLARRLAQVLSDPAIGQLFGRRGRRRVYQLFTWRRVAQQLDALYAAIEGARSGAADASRLAALQQAG